MEEEAQLRHLVLRINEIGAVKFGQFKLKTGVVSPIYFDLRVLVSFPDILSLAVDIIWKRLQASSRSSDFVCGVPYTALPIASVLSVKYSLPMVVCRKERKEYGTGKDIEGVFLEGQKCAVIEDVVTSGLSVMEAVGKLHSAGLKVDTVVAFLDREQGARQNLESKGLNLITVITASQLLSILEGAGKITPQQAGDARDFFRDTKPNVDVPSVQKPAVSRRSFAERKLFASCPVVKDLFEIMERKKTNLCVACDVSSVKEVLDLADKLGPYIAVLKTHVDILSDFDYDALVKPLVALSKRYNFLIFEDRKFADIGNTVRAQYSGGIYRIAQWADISNTHLVSGASSIGSLRDAAKAATADPRGLLLIAQMSTQDTLASGNQLAQLSLDLASKYPEFVAGFICQGRLRQSIQDSDEGLLYCTPGVQIQSQGDSQGQNYKTPDQVVADGADLIIVGRGITSETDPCAAAELYRSRAWDAYLSRCSNI
eukprot:TRINITY_DN1124_c0_g1_i1.p1 TRINITY_DN1124_c0_g1~~TRINITY_DN1124_c0_g1_i1.p1  ORF type:complete len:485 (+),score=72.42 TRINITY_DN1124_c0_g1_i1:28-1482(+)